MKNGKKGTIFFLSSDTGTFIDTDYSLLCKHYRVKRLKFDFPATKRGYANLNTIFHVSAQFLHLIAGLFNCNIVFIWFVDYWALRVISLAHLLNIRVICVIGGWEVAKVHEMNYGGLLDDEFRKKIHQNLKKVDKILAVSEFSKREILQVDPSLNISVIYNAVDIKRFCPMDGPRKSILTVGYISSRQHVKLKGIDILCNVSRRFPELKFLIIGVHRECIPYLKKISSKNVEILPVLSNDEIIPYYQNASIYCQLSWRESFGVALVEAMACGCIPIATNRGALPEVIGKCGYLVEYGDIDGLEGALHKAINLNNSECGRERVEMHFSIEKRELDLIDTINSVMAQ